MVELPRKVPAEVFLNQSLEFLLSTAGYDPEEWAATLFIQTATGKTSQLATNEGGLFKFSILALQADQGGKFNPGGADYFVRVVNGDLKKIIARGQIEILPDPTGDAVDFRSQVKRTLDAIRAVIEGTASRDDQSYTISTENGSRSLSRFSPNELLTLEARYAARYRAEVRRNNRRNGKKSGNTVKAVFRRG